MQRTLRAGLLLLVIFLSGFHALAVTEDVTELVGEVLLEHVWTDESGYLRVRIGNERALSAYGGVERFILGTKGAWLQRWHETKFFPIEQVTWIDLTDPYALNMDEAVDRLRERAEWYEKLPQVGDWHRGNFTYDLGFHASTMAASEAMISGDYLVIVDSDKLRATLLNRSIVERIEWPNGEMTLERVAAGSTDIPTTGGTKSVHKITVDGRTTTVTVDGSTPALLEVSVTDGEPSVKVVPADATIATALEVTVLEVEVKEWSMWQGQSSVPPGHPAGPVAEPALVVTLRVKPDRGNLGGIVWGQGQIGDILSRRTVLRDSPAVPYSAELELYFTGVESLTAYDTVTMTYQLTARGQSAPTTYTFEIEIPQALRKAKFPHIPAVRGMSDLFRHEASVLEQFIADVKAKNATYLRAWIDYSNLDHVYKLLMRETIRFVDVVHTPVSGGDQVAAVLLFWDGEKMEYRSFAAFFRYSDIGWRLYGFFEQMPTDKGASSADG